MSLFNNLFPLRYTVYIYIYISPSHSSKPRDNGSRSSFEYNGRRELEPSGFSFDIEYRISSNHLEKNHHLYLLIYHAFRTISSLPFFLKHSLIRSDSRCRYRVTSGSMVTSNPGKSDEFSSRSVPRSDRRLFRNRIALKVWKISQGFRGRRFEAMETTFHGTIA